MSFISVDGRQRLEGVAKWLESGAPHISKDGEITFDLSVGVQKTECGTACCIAGAVCQFNQPFEVDHLDAWDNDEILFYGEGSVLERATSLLGISEEDANQLFTPEDVCWDEVTADEAAKVIRNYLATGVVDYDKVLSEHLE